MANAYLVVGNSGSLTSTDSAIKSQLEGLGWTVTVKDDGDAEPSMTGYALVVIAESVSTATVSTKYSTVAVPVVLFDTGVAVNHDYTSTASNITSGTQVDVSDTGHPAAGGKTGTVTVMSAGKALRYSADTAVGSGAVDYLIITGQSTQWVGYTYASGATMRNSHTAEARRLFLGLFHESFAGAQTTDAWDLFDAAVAWSAGGASASATVATATAAANNATANASGSGFASAGVATATGAAASASATTRAAVTYVQLVVADKSAPSSYDAAIRTHLQGLGFTVTYVSDEDAVNVTGIDLVVISESVSGATLGSKYGTTAVPVLHGEHTAWDDANLTTAGGNTGTLYSAIYISASGDPIAAGYSGTTTVASEAIGLAWAATSTIGPGAVKVAYRTDDSGQWVLFRYEAGAIMANSATAPARRVIFDLSDEGVPYYSTAAWAIIDASVLWLLRRIEADAVTATATGTAHSASVTASASANIAHPGYAFGGLGAWDAAVSIGTPGSPDAVTATATGTANTPSFSVRTPAGTAFQGGAFQEDTFQEDAFATTVLAPNGTSAGQARNPGAGIGAPAGCATATGDAYGVDCITGFPAGVAAGTGAGYTGSGGVGATAQAAATGTGEALAVTAGKTSSSSILEAATATGEGYDTDPGVGATNATATATGTANDATASLVSGAYAAAEAATATGTAHDAPPRVGATTQDAAGTGEALGADTLQGSALGVATATGAASGVAPSLEVYAGIAEAVGAAVPLSFSLRPNGGIADGSTGQALLGSTAVSGTTGTAGATGSALNVTWASTSSGGASAGVAAASGIAWTVKKNAIGGRGPVGRGHHHRPRGEAAPVQ